MIIDSNIANIANIANTDLVGGCPIICGADIDMGHSNKNKVDIGDRYIVKPFGRASVKFYLSMWLEYNQYEESCQKNSHWHQCCFPLKGKSVNI